MPMPERYSAITVASAALLAIFYGAALYEFLIKRLKAFY